ETRNLSEGIASFSGSPHFFKDVRKQDILPRLIGLSRYSTGLGLICLFKTIPPQADRGNQTESFRIMHVQPTGVAKCGLGAWHVALFRIKLAQGDRRSIMPPVVAHKGFN